MIDVTQPATDKDLGKLWGVGPRRIRELKADGILTSIGPNRYDPCVATQAYIEFKNRPLAVSADGEVIDFNVERARKTKEEADKLERENQLATGEVLDQDEYGHLITEALLVQKRELESLELQLSHLLPGMSNTVREEIKRIAARCHNAVLDLQIDQESDELAKA